MSSSLTSEQHRLVVDAARALDAASSCSGERGEIVRRLASTLGVSVNTAYAYLKRYAGWSSGKKPRKGKGETCVPPELCRAVSWNVLRGRRANGKEPMTMKLAVRILKENGEGIVDPETGEITMPSVETISRAMRKYGCHPEQLRRGKPVGRVRSLYPNHVWQLDASVCVLYYIRGTKKIAMLDERAFNAKKPANLAKILNRRVVRYVVTDHASGAFYVRYEQAAGEDAQGVLRTLVDFIADRGHRDPVHGLPEILYMDPGAGNASSLIMGFCETMGIRVIHHAPGAANATGAVERMQNLIECQFESRLRFMDVPNLTFLQGEADRWRRHFCATAILRRTGKSRNDAWLTISEEKLRTVPRDILEAVAAWKDEKRQVGSDFLISVETHTSFGTRQYDLRELAYHGLNPKDSVRVRLNPFHAPAITVIMLLADGAEKLFTVNPVENDQYGQDLSAPVFGESYKAMPETHTEKVLKQMKMEAYGADSVQEAEKLFKAGKSGKRFDVMADVKEAPLYLGRKGRPAAVAAPTAEPIPMSRVAFALMMKREHPEVWNEKNAAECMSWLSARYPDSVPGAEIDNVVEKICERFTPRKATVSSFSASDERRAACN